MLNRPSVLCPVDFSEASRGALRYAATVAEHFYAGLTVLAVDEPLLTTAANARFSEGWLERRTAQELEAFIRKAFPGRTPQVPELEPIVATGTPAAEILRVGAASRADLIVMSTRGASGVRKMMFGSTTERVLRATTTPVIVSPAHDPGPDSLEDWRRSVKRLLVPVDLSPYTRTHVQVARGLAEALGASLVIAHVLAPLDAAQAHDFAEEVDAARRTAAATRLAKVVKALPPALHAVSTLASGDPAREIARLARDHAVSAVVMGLHSSFKGGPGMGTVTYRLLCEAPVLVVAWPPARLAHRLRFGRPVHSAAS